MAIATAKHRADRAWSSLQTHVRDFIAAEEGLGSFLRELLEERGLNQVEIDKQFEGLVSRLKAHKLWERFGESSSVVALSDYRDGLEKKAVEARLKILNSMQVVSVTDFEALQKQVKSLNRKVNELSRKVKTLSSEA